MACQFLIYFDDGIFNNIGKNLIYKYMFFDYYILKEVTYDPVNEDK